MKRFACLALVLTVAFVGCGKSNEQHSAASDTELIPATLPGDVCVVSGEKIGGENMTPVEVNYLGHKIRFCCSDCIKKFDKNPAKYLAALKAGKPAAP